MIEDVQKAAKKVEDAIEVLLELRMELVMLKYHLSGEKTNET